MCGRFTLTARGEELARHFELPEPPASVARYNIAPTQRVPIVRESATGRESATQRENATGRESATQRESATESESASAAEPGGEFAAGAREWLEARWGLVPGWAKDARIAQRTINARAETASQKPAFRAAIRRRRCLVPATGFYEWTGGRTARQPHVIRRRDGGLFAIAGLWETWQPPASEEGAAPASWTTCTLLTTEANATVRALHHRMPVILAPRDYRAWLAQGARLEDVEALLVPCPPDWLETHPVSRRLNDVRQDDASLLDPSD